MSTTPTSPATSNTSSSQPEPAAEERPLTPASNALPDFDALTDAERELAETLSPEPKLAGEPMLRDEAEEFVTESNREHRNNLVSITLVLVAPAFLFATLWWPFGVSGARSFGEKSPTLATVIGPSAALVVIVLGVIVHFVPRDRHGLLEEVEEGELVASDDSAHVGREALASRSTLMLVSRVGGVLAALAAAACVVITVLSIGHVSTVFGFLALTFVAIAACFALFYVPFTIRRTARLLGA